MISDLPTADQLCPNCGEAGPHPVVVQAADWATAWCRECGVTFVLHETDVAKGNAETPNAGAMRVD